MGDCRGGRQFRRVEPRPLPRPAQLPHTRSLLVAHDERRSCKRTARAQEHIAVVVEECAAYNRLATVAARWMIVPRNCISAPSATGSDGLLPGSPSLVGEARSA